MEKKTEYHDVCVIKQFGGDAVFGLACLTKKSKKMPGKNARIIGDRMSEEFWFDNIPDAQAFYNNVEKTIKKPA